jgi:hypothetical protein
MNMQIDFIRSQVAQLAAQLIHEHGIQDYALAKRKAAKQLGIADAHHLPSNPEITQALQSHLELFHGDSHPTLLAELTALAIHTMQMLQAFNPYVTGAVLNGTATEHSDIQIELFTDNEKEVELFLLNNHIQFKQDQRQIKYKGNNKQIPCFVLTTDTCDIYVSIHSPSQIRNTPRDIPREALKRASLNHFLKLQDCNQTATSSAK